MARPVRECQELMSYEDFNDWVLFYKEYPLLNHHISNMISQLTAITWNAHGGRRKKVRAKDFYPDYSKALLTQEDRARIAVEKMRRR